MANINRDYLVIADLKSGKITSPSMSFYNTDKNIANLFVKLQITMSTNPSITGFVNKEEASNYNVKLTVIKPKTTMLVDLVGIVQDESVMGNGAVYLFDMPQNFTDQVGKYVCELEITCMVNGREEIVTCDPFEYTVKESAVTGLNGEIEPSPDIPVLKQLIDEVRYLQENGGSIVNLSKYQKMEDDKLNTTDKTIVGGINELNTHCLDIKQNKANKSEVDENFSQINQSNIERDKKISSIENINSVQNAKLDTLFNSASGEMERESNTNNIKLDSSKKGTATVNYIKGNTLVNCAKENKELILNDEIKVEGTNCTINDTVEGGLVDVELEGLSFVNASIGSFKKGGSSQATTTETESEFKSTVTTKGSHVCTKGAVLENNTTYTLLCFLHTNVPSLSYSFKRGENYILGSVNEANLLAYAENYKLVKKVVTTDIDCTDIVIGCHGIVPVGGYLNIKDLILLKGDYTNKPIPTEAFTGIKSVGEEVTLTNLVTGTSLVGTSSSETDEHIKLVQQGTTEELSLMTSFEKDKIYTLVYTILESDIKPTSLVLRGNSSSIYPLSSNVMISTKVGTHKISFKCDKVGADRVDFAIQSDTAEGTYVKFAKKFLIVEGGYENSNLEYFEGSVKKYKIETKSQNKNLMSKLEHEGKYYSYDKGALTNNSSVNSHILEIPPNVERIVVSGGHSNYSYWDSMLNFLGGISGGGVNIAQSITLPKGCKYLRFAVDINQSEIQVEIGSVATSYIQPKQHKKVILLDEPLRGIEGGVKDRTVKREGKLFSERKFAYRVFTSNNQVTVSSAINKMYSFAINTPSDMKKYNSSINQQLNTLGLVYEYSQNSIEHYYLEGSQIVIFLNRDKFTNTTGEELTNEFKTKYLSSPFEMIYSTDTTYEEIKGLNNEYPTYADVTHVSTDTIIPCNQKIQNTGIECMLKPSTLYSIHDIKGGSGTAKYNLGGTANTSNKVTTGATLTDNYLRLYGKGLTSKDVEVFEGDTPQTPYFTGMLSSFEDKKITQEMVDSGLEKAENLGKYRATLKVVGKNKLNVINKDTIDMNGIKTEIIQNNILNINGQNSTEINIDRYLLGGWNISTLNNVFVLKKGTYVLSTGLSDQGVEVFLLNKNNSIANTTSSKVFTIEKNIEITGVLVRIHKGYSFNNLQVSIQVEEGNQATQYEPYKEYKTSILLSSPPLKDDEIIIQDGRLKHLHKSINFDIQEAESLHSINNNGIANFIIRTQSDKLCLFNSKNIFCNMLVAQSKLIADVDNEGYMWSNSSTLYVRLRSSSASNTEEFKKWCSVNNPSMVYPLEKTYYEDITPQLPRWILDIFDNSTISIDTIIPVESKFTYTSYIPSIPAMQTNIKGLEEANVDIIATSWDTDFRVCEIEWVLEDAGLTTPSSLYNIKTGGNIMALTRFEQAKIIILGDAYYRPTFQKQLETYLKRNYLTQEEFDTLISMMDAREAIKGEIV